MVARELGLREVLIPWSPGLSSAFGLLIAETIIDIAESQLHRLDEATLDAVRVGSLRAKADAAAAENGLPSDGRALRIGVDMRYAGQAFELTVWTDPTPIPMAALRALFEDEHRSRYGYARGALAVEVVVYRIRLTHGRWRGRADPRAHRRGR